MLLSLLRCEYALICMWRSAGGGLGVLQIMQNWGVGDALQSAVRGFGAAKSYAMWFWGQKLYVMRRLLCCAVLRRACHPATLRRAWGTWGRRRLCTAPTCACWWRATRTVGGSRAALRSLTSLTFQQSDI